MQKIILDETIPVHRLRGQNAQRPSKEDRCHILKSNFTSALCTPEELTGYEQKLRASFFDTLTKASYFLRVNDQIHDEMKVVYDHEHDTLSLQTQNAPLNITTSALKSLKEIVMKSASEPFLSRKHVESALDRAIDKLSEHIAACHTVEYEELQTAKSSLTEFLSSNADFFTASTSFSR